MQDNSKPLSAEYSSDKEVQPENDASANAASSFQRLLGIVQRLRAPDGCPWDREQDLVSLRDALIEESYECVDAINESDSAHIREELGDVFLLATMMSYIQEQDHEFTVSDVLEEVSNKLVRRHPHVFANSAVSTSSEVIVQWNAIKKTEKRTTTDGSKSAQQVSAAGDTLDNIPGSFAPLRMAWEYQKKAAKKGFDWPDRTQIFEKLAEEINELHEAIDTSEKTRIEDELGDLLFTVVNIARSLDVVPDLALQRTNAKFKQRFSRVEREMNGLGLEMSSEHLTTMDELWDKSKIVDKT